MIDIVPLTVLKGAAPLKTTVHTGSADEGANCGAASSFIRRMHASMPIMFAADPIEGKTAEVSVVSCGIIYDTAPIIFKKRKTTDKRCFSLQG